MQPRAKQLSMTFDEGQDVSWLPEQTQKELVATLADLLLDASDANREGGSDDSEDPR